MFGKNSPRIVLPTRQQFGVSEIDSPPIIGSDKGEIYFRCPESTLELEELLQTLPENSLDVAGIKGSFRDTGIGYIVLAALGSVDQVIVAGEIIPIREYHQKSQIASSLAPRNHYILDYYFGIMDMVYHKMPFQNL